MTGVTSYYSFLIFLEQVSEKEEALELVKGKLSGVGEELQSMKNTQAEREMTNKMLENNLQTLQQKYDALLTNHEVRVVIGFV